MEELKKSIKEIVEQNILKVVISNKKDKDEEFNKIVISSLPIALIASITYLAVNDISNLSPE